MAGAVAAVHPCDHDSRYPTIKVYRRGVVLKSEYRGQRSPNAIEAFIKELIASAVAPVQNDDELQEHINRHHRAIVGHFDSEANAAYSVFEAVANRLRDECHFLAQMGSSQAGEGGASIFFKSMRESLQHDAQPDLEGEALEAELYTWAREHCNPMVREITFDNGEELTEEGLPFLILFYDPNEHSPVDEFTEMVKTRFASQRGAINFITADGFKFSHPLRHLGKTKADLPVLALDTFKHMYLFKSFKNIRKPGKLEAFVSDLHSGKLHHNFHHPPADKPIYERDEPDAPDEKPDTLKEKLAEAEKQKNPEVVATSTEKPAETDEPGATTIGPGGRSTGPTTTKGPSEAPAEAKVREDSHEDEEESPEEMSKPVAVKSVLKNLLPSQSRYSFAHNRDEL